MRHTRQGSDMLKPDIFTLLFQLYSQKRWNTQIRTQWAYCSTPLYSISNISELIFISDESRAGVEGGKIWWSELDIKREINCLPFTNKYRNPYQSPFLMSIAFQGDARWMSASRQVRFCPSDCRRPHRPGNDGRAPGQMLRTSGPQTSD